MGISLAIKLEKSHFLKTTVSLVPSAPFPLCQSPETCQNKLKYYKDLC